jgi:hypothetical protein
LSLLINLILEDEGINKETVRDLIRVTCFENGAFRRRPRTLLEKSIRDADLMMVYSDPGQHVATGLFYETAGCQVRQNELISICHVEPYDWLAVTENAATSGPD